MTTIDEYIQAQEPAMLEEFLEKGAISKQQYDKSLHDLTEKMTPVLRGESKK